MTIAAAAEALSVSRRTVERMLARGTLTGYSPRTAVNERAAVILWARDVDEVGAAAARLGSAKRDWSAR
jgi:excisionase family DNA binding protein